MTAPLAPWDPQDGRDRHLDAGAYVLGLLGELEKARFEEHLPGCPRCTEEIGRLGELGPLLAEFRADGATFAEPLAEPAADRGAQPDAESAGRPAVLRAAGAVIHRAGPDGSRVAGPSPRLLDAVLAEVAAAASARRRSRVRRRWLVAAVAAVLTLGGVAAGATVLDPGTPAPVPAVAAVSHTATGADGISATVGVSGQRWGSAVTLRLAGVSGPRSCSLVAVSVQGGHQTVSSWAVPAAGYGTPGAPAAPTAPELRISGSTGYQPGEIGHFEVRDLTDGQLLLLIPVLPGG